MVNITFWVTHFFSNLIELGWTFQPSVVFKTFNLGVTSAQRIDQALKMWTYDIISSMHCLNSLKIVAGL